MANATMAVLFTAAGQPQRHPEGSSHYKRAPSVYRKGNWFKLYCVVLFFFYGAIAGSYAYLIV